MFSYANANEILTYACLEVNYFLQKHTGNAFPYTESACHATWVSLLTWPHLTLSMFQAVGAGDDWVMQWKENQTRCNCNSHSPRAGRNRNIVHFLRSRLRPSALGQWPIQGECHIENSPDQYSSKSANCPSRLLVSAAAQTWQPRERAAQPSDVPKWRRTSCVLYYNVRSVREMTV